MFNRTKILCTIGPASQEYDTLASMVDAGMDGARLNFSHGDYEDKADKIKKIKKLSKELKRPVAIVADLQGPKLRLGKIEEKKEFQTGDTISFSIKPKNDEIPIQFDLSKYLKAGDRIYLNDGLLEVTVTSIKDKTINTVAKNSGWISSHKGINIPDTEVDNKAFTQKDKEDAQFALEHKVDYLAISFVQRASDLDAVKEMIKKYNPQTKIIAKIERSIAIANIREIIAASDMVMIARGDLALETSAAEVPIFQQKIIRLARENQTPVIVATHMLESMVNNPRPTRAEAGDVANAVINQVDTVMLSAESAVGSYPVRAVKIMNDIIRTTEANPEYKNYIKVNWQNIKETDLQFNAITSSAASLSYRIGSQLLAVATASGRTARIISSFRPNASIVGITHDQVIQNQLALIWGVVPLIVEPEKSADLFWQKIIDTIKLKKLASNGQQIILVSGSTLIGVSGATDTIKVVEI